MKKILALILAALLIFCMVACSQKEAEDTGDENNNKSQAESTVTTAAGTYEYGTNEEGDYEITKFSPASLDPVEITLPKETDDGRDIVGISADAFKTCLTIKSVGIPETYLYVDDYAFYGCDNLEKVAMTDSVTKIGQGAFQNCPKLASLTLSKGIITVSEDAFRGCAAITEVDLSGATEVIDQGAFFGCTELTKVTVSDKITYVSAYAFSNASKIAYTVADGAKYLGNAENPYLVLVSAENLDVEVCKVNDKTKLIADRAFAYCSYLDKVELGDAVTVINGTCFENDPAFDKSFGTNEIPQVDITFNEYENGCYLGTDSNPYMVLVYIIATNDDDFKLHKDTKIITDTAFDDSKIEDISYEGTEEQWKSIIKSENWNHDKIINVLWAQPAAN